MQAAASFDVSDVSAAGAGARSRPDRRRVRWPSSSPVLSEIATCFPADMDESAFTDLWFTADQIELWKREARLERITSKLSHDCSSISAPAMPRKRGPPRFPASKRRARLSAESMLEVGSATAAWTFEGGDAAFTAHREAASSGLCLVRGLGGVSADRSHPPQSAMAPQSSLPGGTAGVALPPAQTAAAEMVEMRTQHSAPCLVRATGVSFGTQRVATASLAHRHRAASTSAMAPSLTARQPQSSAIAGETTEQRRPTCNPHGLSMSQRVAALQLSTGRPTVF